MEHTCQSSQHPPLKGVAKVTLSKDADGLIATSSDADALLRHVGRAVAVVDKGDTMDIELR